MDAARPGVEGKRCSEVVQLTDLSGQPVCTPACEPSGTRTIGLYKGCPARLTCTPLDERAVVMVEGLAVSLESHPPLTEREREVIGLVAEGYTDADIGRILGLSAATVRTHVQHIRQKLGARSRAEAAVRASRLNLI